MTDPKLCLLRDSGLKFFGILGASLSHDLNNVLATLNELGGLLEELIAASERGKPLDPERLKRTIGKMPAQVKRGQGYVKQLNRLSHSVDHDSVPVDLRESLAEVMTLCERVARLREVRLESSVPDTALALTGSPFDVLHVLYRCIDVAMAASPRGSSIYISSEPLEQGARVVVTGRDELEAPLETASEGSPLAVLVDAVGGTLEVTNQRGHPVRVVVDLPRVLRTRAAGARDGTA